MNNTYLSVVIPCHNEAHCLRESVMKVITYCERFYGSHYEIVLSENASTDGTALVVDDLQRTFRPVRAMHSPEKSKAAAVRSGMLASIGDYRYMCDADLSAPIDSLRTFFAAIKDGWDMAIGSRELPDSRVTTSFRRWAAGRVFSLITRAVMPELDYRDTQCGFKLFTARSATEIFEHVTCNSFAFDVEVLYLALKYGYYCTEVPITWANAPHSTVRMLRDSVLMLSDVLEIKERHRNAKPSYKTKNVPA